MNISADPEQKTLEIFKQNHWQIIAYINLTTDEYINCSADCLLRDHPPIRQTKQGIFALFKQFAESPLCHENDRERFLAFTSPDHLRDILIEGDASRFVYRRKSTDQNRLFDTFMLTILPIKNSSEDLTGYFMVRNITSEVRAYDISLKEGAGSRSFVPGKRTILIIEDNELNRELLTGILAEDYHILTAENGAIGLDVLQQHMDDISVIILDIQMPVMNGYEFLETIRDNVYLSNIPVIVSTGNNHADEEQKCLALGAVDFVPKPYNCSIIKSRLASIIRLRESAATLSILKTDERSGLYTQQAFNYYSKQAIEKYPNRSFSLIVFDIDHFSTVNEFYGEETATDVLRQVGNTLRDHAAPDDVFGHAGASRFLMLKQGQSRDDLDTWVDHFIALLNDTRKVKGISFRAGVYDQFDKTLPMSIVYDRAVTAMADVGESFAKRFAHYDREHAEKALRLNALESEMRDAYDKDQFRVYYQPKHDAATGALVGAEALIRWVHPVYGFLSPAEFIPLFEKNGFISYADYYVLKRTCKNLREWQDAGIRPVPVSINVSRRDFDFKNYLSIVTKPVNQYRIEPSLIHIEVTESFFSDKIEILSQTLQECRDAGFKVELDDFGSGYSSLTTLSDLPLDVLKLDMSFMHDFRNARKMKILATCVGLARSLGLKTVAEGVENEAQIALLKQIGCDWIQGYYYSKPLPEDAFRAYLIKHS